MNIQKFKIFLTEELGPGPRPKTDLDRFIDDFIGGVGNVFIMSTLHRMLDTNQFIKFNKIVYTFTDDEIEKLNRLKPYFDQLVEVTSHIKKIQEEQSHPLFKHIQK